MIVLIVPEKSHQLECKDNKMKKLILPLLLTSIFIFTGCQQDLVINPTVKETTIATRTETGFLATMDGIDHWVLDSRFTCIDNILFERATESAAGGVYSGPDSVPDTCLPELAALSSAAETLTPIFR